MKGGCAKTKVFAQRLQDFAFAQQKPDGRYIAVVSAPLQEGSAIASFGGRRVSLGDVCKHKVGAAFGDLLSLRHLLTFLHQDLARLLFPQPAPRHMVL